MRPEPRLPDGSYRRVCVVLLTGLGDVVHGLPVVNALKRARPDVHVTWVVEPMPAPIVSPHPAVDDVVVFRKKEGARGVLALRRALSARSFDLTLNFNIYFKSIFPTLLSGAPRRLGFGRPLARDGVWLVHTDRLPRRERAHTQDMFLDFLGPLGVEPGAPEWRLEPTPAERAEQAEFFRRFDQPVVAVVPASANAKKDWLPDRYAEVLDALEHERGFRTLIVGGPSDRERRLTDAILAGTRARPEVVLGDGIRRLVWLVGGSDLVIAPDTGPVHIARATGTPVIGLYGHTNPWRVGPYRAYEDLWVDAYTDPGRAPDAADATPKLGRMERITAAAVLERVERARDRYRVGAA